MRCRRTKAARHQQASNSRLIFVSRAAGAPTKAPYPTHGWLPVQLCRVWSMPKSGFWAPEPFRFDGTDLLPPGFQGGILQSVADFIALLVDRGDDRTGGYSQPNQSSLRKL